MAFAADERAVLLAVRGVGPTVIDRLEQIGLDSLEALAAAIANQQAVTWR